MLTKIEISGFKTFDNFKMDAFFSHIGTRQAKLVISTVMIYVYEST
jgi:hypothetical protein